MQSAYFLLTDTMASEIFLWEKNLLFHWRGLISDQSHIIWLHHWAAEGYEI